MADLTGRTDKEIWPSGRYEVYKNDDGERLNGFHTRGEAEECAARFPGSVVLDRADRFVHRLEDGTLHWSE